jgi:hypothetical protein
VAGRREEEWLDRVFTQRITGAKLEDAGVGFLHEIVGVAQRGEAPAQPRAERCVVRLHVVGEPAVVVV